MCCSSTSPRCRWGSRPRAACSRSSSSATRRSRRGSPRSSRPPRTASRPSRSTSSRASARWPPTTRRWASSSSSASRRRRAASPDRGHLRHRCERHHARVREGQGHRQRAEDPDPGRVWPLRHRGRPDGARRRVARRGRSHRPGSWPRRGTAAEQVAYSTEKSLAEHDAKLDDETKTEIRTKIDAVKQAIDGDDVGEIRSRLEALREASFKLGELVYQQAQQSATTGSGNGATAPRRRRGRRGDRGRRGRRRDQRPLVTQRRPRSGV